MRPGLDRHLEALIQARQVFPARHGLGLLALHLLGHPVEMPRQRLDLVPALEMKTLGVVALGDRARRGHQPVHRTGDPPRREPRADEAENRREDPGDDQMLRERRDLPIEPLEGDPHPHGAPLDLIALDVDREKNLEDSRASGAVRLDEAPVLLAHRLRGEIRRVAGRLPEGILGPAVGGDLPFLVVDHDVGDLASGLRAAGRLVQRDVVVGEKRGRGEPRDAARHREAALPRLAQERFRLAPHEERDGRRDEPDHDHPEGDEDAGLQAGAGTPRRVSDQRFAVPHRASAPRSGASPWPESRFPGDSFPDPRPPRAGR